MESIIEAQIMGLKKQIQLCCWCSQGQLKACCSLAPLGLRIPSCKVAFVIEPESLQQNHWLDYKFMDEMFNNLELSHTYWLKTRSCKYLGDIGFDPLAYVPQVSGGSGVCAQRTENEIVSACV